MRACGPGSSWTAGNADRWAPSAGPWLQDWILPLGSEMAAAVLVCSGMYLQMLLLLLNFRWLANAERHFLPHLLQVVDRLEMIGLLMLLLVLLGECLLALFWIHQGMTAQPRPQP